MKRVEVKMMIRKTGMPRAIINLRLKVVPMFEALLIIKMKVVNPKMILFMMIKIMMNDTEMLVWEILMVLIKIKIGIEKN